MKATTQAEFVERTKCINCGGSELTELSTGWFTQEPLLGYFEADPWGIDPMPHLQDAKWVFVECSDCGQAFHSRILNEQWNEKRFSEWMDGDSIAEFESRRGDQAQRAMNVGKSHAGHVLRIERLTRGLRSPSEPVRLLDFGCGWGDFLAVCQTYGFDTTGVDRSQARRGGSKVPIYSSLDELAGEAFHAIVLFEVLEHLDSPSDVLRALAPFLVSGGILVLETPDCSGVTDIHSHDDYRKIDPLDHINAFTHQTLKSFAERLGFRCINRGRVHVTADLSRLIRTEVKGALQWGERSTQLYFVKEPK